MKTREIAELVGGELVGDGEVEIVRATSPGAATGACVVFIAPGADFSVTKAGCAIISLDADPPSGAVVIKVADPKLAFAKTAAALHPRKTYGSGVNRLASVSGTAILGAECFVGAHASVGHNSQIGDRTQILAGARIGDNVRIGSDCLIHPNVVIYDGCSLGDGVTVHSGTVIGADGFGYVRDGKRGYQKFPQIGKVSIGNDVEIGANSCIDRGALGDTVIGDGTKIDNLVQIAHNCKIGKRVVIAAHTGISGSVTIEDDCVLAGQTGVGEGATIKSGASIGGQAGVTPNKIVRKGVWWGTPVQPLDEYLKQLVEVRGLKKLKEKIAELQRQIEELTKKDG